jgi:hypothetical protein
MNLSTVTRSVVAAICGCAAIWHGCIVPMRYEVVLRGLEGATLATIRLPDDESRVLARRTLDTVRKYRDRFSYDVRLAMIEGTNERILGRAGAAVTAYERALRYDRRPEIYLNLALAEQELGERDRAVHHLANAIRFAPEMASDVVDIRLKQEAIAIIRRGHAAPPLCCVARYHADNALEMLETAEGVTRARTVPRGINVPLPRGWSPQFAWNERGAVNLIVRDDATGAAERLLLAHNGTLLSRQPLPAIGAGWHIAGIGEFAAPGATSLLFGNRLTSEVKLWAFDDAGRVTETPAPSLAEQNAYAAACADFDRDGHVDVLYRSSTGEDFIWLLDRSGHKSKSVLPPSGFQRELVAAADFTGDSQPDLLWYDFETGRNILWVMNGTSIQGVRYWPTP